MKRFLNFRDIIFCSATIILYFLKINLKPNILLQNGINTLDRIFSGCKLLTIKYKWLYNDNNTEYYRNYETSLKLKTGNCGKHGLMDDWWILDLINNKITISWFIHVSSEPKWDVCWHHLELPHSLEWLQPQLSEDRSCSCLSPQDSREWKLWMPQFYRAWHLKIKF